MPIVDQYTYLGVEISKDCSWDTNTAKVLIRGKGKAHVGEMDAILTGSLLDTRIKRCILINMIAVAKVEYICRRSMGGEREVSKTVGNSTDDSS